MPDKNRKIDNTHLSIDHAEERGLIHRDYIAHCLRWSHVAKMMHQRHRYKTTRILDVGCGVDVPLARILHTNRLIVEEYVGVDYNSGAKFVDRNWGKMPVYLYGGTIFPKNFKLKSFKYQVNGEGIHKLPNLITCFEVLEHVTPSHVVSMLRAMHKIVERTGGEVVLSTPVWNVKNTAANHINEMRHGVLGSVIESVGFSVDYNYGTFGNISDYKDELKNTYGDGVARFFDDQREYHDTNLLANMFCSPFPHLSRNALWRLTPAKPGYTRKFPLLDALPKPWSSSDSAEDFKKAEDSQ